MTRALSALFLTGSLLALPAEAAPGDGLKLADVDLRDAKDWDLVRLPPCSGPRNEPVTSLGVRVTRFPAEINRLKVSFYNGEQQELSVRERFTPGSKSRWIDLSGQARCIKTIRIIGDTDSLGWRPGKQARVSFFGKGSASATTGRASTPVGDKRPGARRGSAELGRMGAVRLTDAKDWDRLVLPRCAGSANEAVNRLKVRVNDHPAQIDRLVVSYHNGGSQELKLRKRFSAGSESVWHDLRGPARCIASIRIVGDTDSLGWRPGKQAQVVFWGKAL